jgi:iron complex outermembrane receptor protein
MGVMRNSFLAAAVAAAIGLHPAESQADGEAIEEIIATGSRIVRTDKFQEAGHVIEMDEIQIDAFGELSIADILRSSPLNIHGSFNERSGFTNQSNATINLRGLGSNRTLVLVDGMRVPGSPVMTASSTNINMLPMVAVQRVDILADGASAVYGSDAMAGVVNIVLHRNFEGFEVAARYGDRTQDDGSDEAISLLAGKAWDRGNVVVALEYSHRDPLWDRDRYYTASQASDLNGDGRIDVIAETVGISPYGRTWRIFDPVTGYAEFSAAADCPDSNGFVGALYAGAYGYPDDTVCAYAFADISANRAELEKMNGYVYGSYELSGRAEFYARAMIAKNESFGRYAPSAAQWPSPPPDHPHNPFDLDQMIADGTITDQAAITGFYRWENIGPRDSLVDDFQWDLAAGIKGALNDRIDFDVYAQAGEYQADDLGRYFLYYPGLDYVLANGIDPFSQEGIEAMRTETWTDSFTEQNRAYGHLQIDAWDLFGAGESIALVGLEYVSFDYENLYDPRSEAGEVGGSAGFSNGGDRDIATVFLEYLVPLTEGTEVSFAGRYDDYSDFGGTFTPSIGIASRITDSLQLRARWGEGFVAPNMETLYGPSQSGQRFFYDPVIDSDWLVQQYSFSNPELQPETSESLSVGFNWEYLDGHSIDVTYYAIDIEDVISLPDGQDLLWADAAGETWNPDGLRVERVGEFVTDIYSYYVNANRLEASGIDVLLSSSFDTSYGYFDLNAFYSKQLSFRENAYYRGSYQDTRNFPGQPDTRAQVGIRWGFGNHSVDLVASYIGKHAVDAEQDFETGVLTALEAQWDSWTTANISYVYDAAEWGIVRVGATNVTDEDPPLDPTQGLPATLDLYDYTGRVLFVEYRKTFDWF